MTRSKELRRIERALEHPSEPELRWALAHCEYVKTYIKSHSHHWYRIEKEVRAALEALKRD